jgi:uncharacterized protein (DUF305 family)
MKRVFTLFVVPVAAFTLAACSANANSTPGQSMDMSSAAAAAATAPAAGRHNAQDVTFAQMMIPHHRQAIEMAKMAATRASTRQVKTLATTIEGAQGPEVSTMTGWLKTWGAAMPMPSMSGMGGMNHGNGMMSDADMSKLGKLSGMAFDKAFLQMMIKHHQGAVTMAKAEQARGEFPDAKSLAATIVSSQTAQITTMRNLLGGM